MGQPFLSRWPQGTYKQTRTKAFMRCPFISSNFLKMHGSFSWHWSGPEIIKHFSRRKLRLWSDWVKSSLYRHAIFYLMLDTGSYSPGVYVASVFILIFCCLVILPGVIAFSVVVFVIFVWYRFSISGKKSKTANFYWEMKLTTPVKTWLSLSFEVVVLFF